MVGTEKMNESEPLNKCRKFEMMSKPRYGRNFGKSMTGDVLTGHAASGIEAA